MRTPGLALLLAACATSPGSADLRAFTLTDLRAAETLAAGDMLAAPCYATLIRALEAGPGNVTGAVSAFQLARNLRHSDTLKLACGGLLIDEQQMIARLGALAAGGL